jgi:ABC-2 family transporter protein
VLARGSIALLLVGLLLLSLGTSIVGNALFPPGGSTIINGDYLDSFGGAPSSHVYYAFLKPSDRMTVSLQGNDSAGALSLTVTRLAGEEPVLDRTSVGNLFAIFTPTARGTYVMSVSLVPSGSEHYEFSETSTVIGNAPTDFFWLGEALAAVGAAFSLGSFAVRGRRRMITAAPEVGRPPPLAGDRGAWKNFVLLLRTDLFQGRKVFFAIPIFLAVTYSAGRFLPSLIPLPYTVTSPNLADLFSPSLSPYNDWLNVFPVVVALAAYSFSYERDGRVLRSTMLNPIGVRTLFFAKLTSMVFVVEVPIALGILFTLAQFDPSLLASSPLTVLQNAPDWLLVYFLYGLIMIGFAILPAVFFRKPVYAFVVPIFFVLLIGTEGFGLRDYLPWQVWILHGTSSLSSLNFQGGFDVGAFLSATLSVVGFAFVLGLLSAIAFSFQDKE